MDKYEENTFYSEDGWPPEEYRYCHYALPVFDEETLESDYDQFALVVNAIVPYLRLAKNRGNSRLPCGCSLSPATDGNFAKMNNEERDKLCPKIAWGFSAVFLANLKYDSIQDDYILLKPLREIMTDYYKEFLSRYLKEHSGLRCSHISEEQKVLDFIDEHSKKEKELWEKSTPLRQYDVLCGYANDYVKEYVQFLQDCKKVIMVKLMSNNNQFSTEIRVPYPNSPCIKVFFLDDTRADDAKIAVEGIQCVKNVNITHSGSRAHPGNTLTVYPKPMITAEQCEKDIIEVLTQFFSNVKVGKMQVHNEAYFAGIENQILGALDQAGATIDVCVAWFTNTRLRDKLLEKKKQGVEVRVIIYKDGVNASKGVDLTGLKHKEFRGERGGVLHDKFCVIDNANTISGSYNWTENAENKNDEDAGFHMEDYHFASEYTKRFNQMWNRDEVTKAR